MLGFGLNFPGLMERWVSGLNQQFAKLPYPIKGTGGSNPPLSAGFLQICRTGHKSGFLKFSGCSVARSARLLWEQEVAGSNPATPT